MRSEIVAGFAIALLAMAPGRAHDMEHMHHQVTQQPLQQPAATVPDVPVLDQDGKRLNFYSDLMRGRTVAINFIYTSCTTFCPMLTANFRMVQQELGARIGKDVELISISIDPVTDTPAKLKAFGAQFESGPGWTFVTGAQPDIARLLDKLGQPLGDPADHTPLVLVRNDKVGGWTHVDGNDPNAIRDALVAAAGPGAKADAADAARAYMQNPLLLTQDDKPVHFFDDLLRGKIVLINFILTNCQDTCPMVTANLARVQGLLGDKVGRSINMISLSVDPERDQPAELKKFAGNFDVKPGWYFLTGAPPEIDPLLRRLAGYTTDRLDHSTALIIGNVETGVWAKVFGMAEPAAIARAVLALQSTK
jgi:cytochrome oxidase Cu insertion factor (SCO1/SenC/PrrC family)